MESETETVARWMREAGVNHRCCACLAQDAPDLGLARIQAVCAALERDDGDPSGLSALYDACDRCHGRRPVLILARSARSPARSWLRLTLATWR